RSFKQMKASDVISQLAGEAGVTATVTATETVYDYLFQHDETDYDFIVRLAARAGQVVRCSQGALTTKPLTEFASTAGPKLNFGEELHEFRPRLTSAHQPSGYTITGWDPKTKAAVVGQATSAELATTLG